MAEKTDEEIIKELGLEQDSTDGSQTQNDSLEPLTNENEQDFINNEESDLVEEVSDNNTIENEDFDEAPVQKKKPKILKILIAVIAGLSVVLTIGTILYLTGFFDEEEIKKEPPKEQAKAIEIKNNEPDIDMNSIDKNKLNQKLKMLTKTEILDKEELEAEERRIKEEEERKKEEEQKALDEIKKKEEQRVAKEKEALEKEKQMLEQRQEAIKKEQEEFLKLQEQIKQEFEEQKKQLFKEIEEQKNSISKKSEPVKQNTSVENIIEQAIATQTDIKPVDTQNIAKEEVQVDVQIQEPRIPLKEDTDNMMNANLFLPFINVAVVKGNLYKAYLDKIESFDKKISLCRDSKNRIEIYFGPYESNAERTKVFKNLTDSGYKDAYLVDFTKEEHEKRCKY